MIAVSSGSTGEPAFWPRFVSDELAVAWRFEQVFRDSFRADQRRTLAVICFALGTWVGGMYTTAAVRHVAQKGYPITVITPGNNKDEIFRVIERLSGAFDQTVLCGYPPFLKDVIDTGLSRGVPWERYAIKLVLAGEVFSEEWRSLMGERAKITAPCYGSASLYGTADAGVLGCETPLSVAIRKLLAESPEAARDLFGEPRLPTLVQYDPLSRFLEAEGGALYISCDNGVPLVRYNILDKGGVIGYDAMLAFLKERGLDPMAELDPPPERRGVRRLPFAYVFGRSDFTVSYFGANIYPENVTVGLEQPGVKEWTTGKFVLLVEEDEDKNKRLSVIIELAPGAQATEERRRAAAESIERHLVRQNSELANYVPAGKRTPAITLLPLGDPAHFPVGVKHRYTRRSPA
jgi:phenylacetate-CoA ligase